MCSFCAFLILLLLYYQVNYNKKSNQFWRLQNDFHHIQEIGSIPTLLRLLQNLRLKPSYLDNFKSSMA